MANEITKAPPTGNDSPFERIKRTNDTGNEYWSSRDFSLILGYSDYRNFEQVIKKAKAACFNSGYHIEDHFVDINEMIEIGKGGQRPVTSVYMSRYACYLVIQNADPTKEIVAMGQTYFAVQTRRQELSDRQLAAECVSISLFRSYRDIARMLFVNGCKNRPKAIDKVYKDGRNGRIRTGTDEHGQTRTNTDEHGRIRTNTDEYGRNGLDGRNGR